MPGCEYLGFARLGLPGAEGPGLCSPERGGNRVAKPRLSPNGITAQVYAVSSERFCITSIMLETECGKPLVKPNTAVCVSIGLLLPI